MGRARLMKKLRKAARRAYATEAQLVAKTVAAPNRRSGEAAIAVNHPKTQRGMVRMMKRGIAREFKREKQK